MLQEEYHCYFSDPTILFLKRGPSPSGPSSNATWQIIGDEHHIVNAFRPFSKVFVSQVDHADDQCAWICLTAPRGKQHGSESGLSLFAASRIMHADSNSPCCEWHLLVPSNRLLCERAQNRIFLADCHNQIVRFHSQILYIILLTDIDLTISYYGLTSQNL